jgi:hypothetical protein
VYAGELANAVVAQSPAAGGEAAQTPDWDYIEAGVHSPCLDQSDGIQGSDYRRVGKLAVAARAVAVAEAAAERRGLVHAVALLLHPIVGVEAPFVAEVAVVASQLALRLAVARAYEEVELQVAVGALVLPRQM